MVTASVDKHSRRSFAPKQKPLAHGDDATPQTLRTHNANENKDEYIFFAIVYTFQHRNL